MQNPEFTSPTELRQHYESIRRRLSGPVQARPSPAPATRPLPLPHSPAAVVALSHDEQIARMHRLMDGLSAPRWVRLVIAGVLDEHNVFWWAVISKGRTPHLVEARRDISRELYQQGMTFGSIGRLVRRDPTTVRYAVLGVRR